MHFPMENGIAGDFLPADARVNEIHPINPPAVFQGFLIPVFSLALKNSKHFVASLGVILVSGFGILMFFVIAFCYWILISDFGIMF